MNLPNPAEIGQDLCRSRPARLAPDHPVHGKEGQGRRVDAPTDELGVAKAFMDLSARLMANPYKMAQTQMNMMWDYFSLWQGSMMKMMGMPGSSRPGRRPEERVTIASRTKSGNSISCLTSSSSPT